MKPSASAFVATAAAAAVIYVYRRRRKSQQLLSLISLRSAFFTDVATAPLPPPFSAWEQLAAQLPHLNKSRQICATIERELELHRVTGSGLSLAQIRRARVLLGCLVASYCNGAQAPWEQLIDADEEEQADDGRRFTYRAAAADDAPPPPPTTANTNVAADASPAPHELPPSLGVPWREVSEVLGMPPILTATDLDLWNKGTTELSLAPADALVGFRQMVSITGTASERGFHAVPFTLQLILAPLLPSLLAVPELVARADSKALEKVSAAVERAVKEAHASLKSIYDLVDVGEFYDIYRPLLGGWAGRGLRLPSLGGGDEGGAAYVANSGGPSAGQTAIVILIDLALGVEHGPKLKGFQLEMREYLPREHRELIAAFDADVQRAGSVRTAALAAGAAKALVDAHAAALKALASMRAYHLGIATHYLRRSLKGTGGSDFRSMLDEGLRSTRKSHAGA